MTALDLLERRPNVLLDFDGPVCAMFAGLSAPTITGEMLDLLADRGILLPTHFADGPHSVFYHAGRLYPAVRQELHDFLTAREVAAAQVAEPTPGATELLRAWLTAGRSVAIVSNNADVAINGYLNRVGLGPAAVPVFGRPGDPSLMKPDPYLLLTALQKLGWAAADTVMLGDSTTDIEAAHAAGVASIAYANKPGKRELFQRHMPEVIIDRMTELLEQAQPALS